MSIIQRLKELRKSKNFTQEQLASKLNLSVTAYINYETGKRDIPLTVIMKLSKIIGLDYNWLLTGEETSTPSTTIIINTFPAGDASTIKFPQGKVSIIADRECSQSESSNSKN